MTLAYYNEHDPFAAQWLRNLVAAGHIASGDVDDRDIRDVRPADLAGYGQCHFFAGIVGWSLALRLAGWSDSRPVWTGSCPCQPFSAVGKGKAADDERHLWPQWMALIAERRPAILFGEQVEAAIGWGWLDAVFSDLEGEGYACGAAVLPACSVGAPHIRQRLWFVADALPAGRPERRPWTGNGPAAWSGAPRRLEHAPSEQVGLPGRARLSGSAAGELGNAAVARLEGAAGAILQGRVDGPPSDSPWRDLEWLPCRDGKLRPTQSGLQPLAHGVPARVGKLRAAGNAIVPQAAAEFITAASLGP